MEVEKLDNQIAIDKKVHLMEKGYSEEYIDMMMGIENALNNYLKLVQKYVVQPLLLEIEKINKAIKECMEQNPELDINNNINNEV